MRQSLFLLFALFLSLSASAQKKRVPLKPPVPVISRPVNGLGGTKWRLTLDTGGQRTVLEFHRIRDNAAVPFLVQFSDDATFLLTVQSPQCSFKAKGTCEISFPSATQREGELELTGPGGFYFSRYNNQSACAEKLKKKIGNRYRVTHRDEESFSLEEEVVESLIEVPAGQ